MWSKSNLDKLEATTFGEIIEGHTGNALVTQDLSKTSFGELVVFLEEASEAPAAERRIFIIG